MIPTQVCVWNLQAEAWGHACMVVGRSAKKGMLLSGKATPSVLVTCVEGKWTLLFDGQLTPRCLKVV